MSPACPPPALMIGAVTAIVEVMIPDVLIVVMLVSAPLLKLKEPPVGTIVLTLPSDNPEDVTAM